MLSRTCCWPRAWRNHVFNILGYCVLLACIGNAQTDQSQPFKRKIEPAELSRALSRVKGNDFSGYDAEVLGEVRAVEAIPSLEKQFARSNEVLDKAKFAQVLVKLGAKDDTYWTYLVNLVTPILNSQEPDSIAYDNGKELPGVAPGFEQWVNSNKLDLPTALEKNMYIHPGMVGLLALTEDRRAIPYLQIALSAPNYSIEAIAAEGLAAFDDKGSIPSIIAAAEKAPAAAAELIARSLLYFDDRQAQEAFDKHVPTKRAQLLRDAKAKGKRPLH